MSRDIKAEIDKFLGGRGVTPPPVSSPAASFSTTGERRYTFRVVVLQIGDEVQPELLIPSDLPHRPSQKEAQAIVASAVFLAQRRGIMFSDSPVTLEIDAPLRADLTERDVALRTVR